MATCIIVGAVSKSNGSAPNVAIRMLKAVEHELPLIKHVTLHTQRELLESNSVGDLEKSLQSHSPMALATACLSTSGARCWVLGDLNFSSATMIGKIFNLPGAPTSLIKLFEKGISDDNDIGLYSKRFLSSLDGQYALVIRWGDTFLLARDPVGVKPLYVAQNEQVIAFSSRRRALWAMGLRDCRSLSQPTLISDRRIRRINLGMKMEALRSNENLAIESLALSLRSVIKKMVAQAGGKVAVLFSGGLDSSVIAKLTKDLGIRCTLYCAGKASSRDMVSARKMSSALDLPLVEKEVTYDDVADNIVRVARLIESVEMVAVSTSLPIYFATKEAATRGERIILYGQGADELFGGYGRYEETLISKGNIAVCSQMLNDIANLGTIIPMYDQIGLMNLTDLFAPFLDSAVVRFSLEIPLKFKLFKDNHRVSRKYLLRKVAGRIGLPVDLLPEQKVAVQFGSGVAGILDKMARQAGYTRDVARRKGFSLPIKAYLMEIGGLAEIPS